MAGAGHPSSRWTVLYPWSSSEKFPTEYEAERETVFDISKMESVWLSRPLLQYHCILEHFYLKKKPVPTGITLCFPLDPLVVGNCQSTFVSVDLLLWRVLVN